MRWPSLATTMYQCNSACGTQQWADVFVLTNDSSTQGHISSEVNISSHSQMIQLYNFWYLLEALLKLLDLLFHHHVYVSVSLVKTTKFSQDTLS